MRSRDKPTSQLLPSEKKAISVRLAAEAKSGRGGSYTKTEQKLIKENPNIILGDGEKTYSIGANLSGQKLTETISSKQASITKKYTPNRPQPINNNLTKTFNEKTYKTIATPKESAPVVYDTIKNPRNLVYRETNLNNVPVTYMSFTNTAGNTQSVKYQDVAQYDKDNKLHNKVLNKFLPKYTETKLSFSDKGTLKNMTTQDKDRLSFYTEKWKDPEDYIKTPKVKKNIPGSKFYSFTADVVRGAYKGLKEKPIKTIALTGVSFAAPKAFSAAGTLLKPITNAALIVAPKTSAFIGAGIGLTIPSLYVYSKGKQVLSADNKGEALGEFVSTEYAPMITGGYLGSRFFQITEGYTSTAGRTKIKTENLVPKSVIEGKQSFPMGPRSASKQLKIFQKQAGKTIPGEKDPIMFHATDDKAFISDKFVTQAGTSELPGLYGSPYVSAYFTKVSNEVGTLYGGNLLNPYSKPGVLAIKPFKFVKGKTAPRGSAFIPGIKTELEAIIPPDTTIVRTGQKFFFTWKGVRIPIDQAATLNEAGKSSLTGNIIKSGSYSGVGSYPVVTPANIISASYSPSNSYTMSISPKISPSYGSSYSSSASYSPSYKPSYKPSYNPSYTKSYNLSYKDSYKPSYSPSYTPSYKPSYKASYQASYSPSYTTGYNSYYTPTPDYTPDYTPDPTFKIPPFNLNIAYLGRNPSKLKFFTPGFDVLVKKKGKFVKQNVAPLTKEGALSLGFRKTEYGAAATFKILPSLGKATKGSSSFIDSFRLNTQYNKKKDNIYVEKSKYRISTKGEKNEITFKGLNAKWLNNFKF
jgi:hypothetical protein